MFSDLLKQFGPIIIALVSTGGFFTFVIKILARHDTQNSAKARERKAASKRARTYELAFRYAAAHCKDQAQMIGPGLVAFRQGNIALATPLLDYACGQLLEQLPQGAWTFKNQPNFIELAREEIKATEEREAAETAAQTTGEAEQT